MRSKGQGGRINEFSEKKKKNWKEERKKKLLESPSPCIVDHLGFVSWND